MQLTGGQEAAPGRTHPSSLGCCPFPTFCLFSAQRQRRWGRRPSVPGLEAGSAHTERGSPLEGRVPGHSRQPFFCKKFLVCGYGLRRTPHHAVDPHLASPQRGWWTVAVTTQ